MPVLAFPGPVAPPPPSVTVEVPDGWDALPAGPVVEVHLAAAVDDEADDDVSRLVVATGRVRGATLDDDSDVLQSVLETLVVGGTG